MLPEYRTIYQGGEDEIVEKKSRFIATVIPVENEEEALEFIEKTKKQYWDARHNCFAYVIGERGQLQRCSDAESRTEQPENQCWMYCLEMN